MVCCSWSTLHMQEASEEPFGLAHGFGEAHVLIFRTCHSFSELAWLAKRLLVDQVDAAVFGVHCERSVVRVARPCASCVLLPGVLYVLWCFRCGLPLFRVSSGFPLQTEQFGSLTTFFLINEFSSSPANIQKKNQHSFLHNSET
jgi:hypothetical protein